MRDTMPVCRKNEKGVSEVMSTILLVSVTVILAAIIAAFVFGLIGNIHGGKIVASTIERTNSSYVSVTFVGGQNANSVTGINWTVGGNPATIYINSTSNTNGIQNQPSSGGILAVGSNALISAPNPGKDRVIGVVVFTDGSKQIILDKTL